VLEERKQVNLCSKERSEKKAKEFPFQFHEKETSTRLVVDCDNLHNKKMLSAGHRSPSPPLKDRPGDLLELTVNSLMEGVEEAKVLVSSNCKVSDLKNNVSDVCDILPDKMLLLYKNVELKYVSHHRSSMCTGKVFTVSEMTTFLSPVME
ncbi:hypothetical protein GCK32_020478, partial [Trichostrongylus colubriformis]